jgi:hypothetical protein
MGILTVVEVAVARVAAYGIKQVTGGRLYLGGEQQGPVVFDKCQEAIPKDNVIKCPRPMCHQTKSPKFLRRCVPWTQCPLEDGSLGYGVPDRFVLTLDLIGVLLT